MNLSTFLPEISILLLCYTSTAINPLKLFEYGTKGLFGLQFLNSNEGTTISPERKINKIKLESANKNFGIPKADGQSILDSIFELHENEYYNTSQETVTKNNENVVSSSTERNKEDEHNLNSLSKFLNIVHFLPLEEETETLQPMVISPDDRELHDHIDTIRKQAWAHFKSIILSYLNVIDSPKSDHQVKLKESLPIKMLRNVLSLGDNVNILHLIGKKINPNIKSFLTKKFHSSLSSVLGDKFSGFNNTDFMPVINDVVNDFAWASLRHIINDLKDKIKKQNSNGAIGKYIEDLRVSNPIAAKGIQFVWNLPDNFTSFESLEQGRSLRNRKLYTGDKKTYDSKDYIYIDDLYLARDDSYGHKDYGYGHDYHGGYGHDVSYHHKGIFIDPYLILAGIGTGALLAFVGFTILTTDDDGVINRRRIERSLDDNPNLTQMSSLILPMIENGKGIYELFPEDQIDELIHDVNSLWGKSDCPKCQVFENFKKKNLLLNAKTLTL